MKIYRVAEISENSKIVLGVYYNDDIAIDHMFRLKEQKNFCNKDSKSYFVVEVIDLD